MAIFARSICSPSKDIPIGDVEDVVTAHVVVCGRDIAIKIVSNPHLELFSLCVVSTCISLLPLHLLSFFVCHLSLSLFDSFVSLLFSFFFLSLSLLLPYLTHSLFAFQVQNPEIVIRAVLAIVLFDITNMVCLPIDVVELHFLDLSLHFIALPILLEVVFAN